MDKSYFVFECKSEQEYGEILAILAMHQMKPYKITDDLFQLSDCANQNSTNCACLDSIRESQGPEHKAPTSPVFVDLSLSNVKPQTDYDEVTVAGCGLVGEPLFDQPEKQCRVTDNPSGGVYGREKLVDIYNNDQDVMCHEQSDKNIKSEYDSSTNNDSFLTADLSRKRRRRDATLKKFHEFILELLLDSRYEHLIHVSGSPSNNFIQFTIPDRRRFATVWGVERGDPNYSSTSLVNKDFWNAQKAEIFTRVLFQDPMLVYKIEPGAEARFSRILSEKNLTMTAVLQFCRQRLREKGNI